MHTKLKEHIIKRLGHEPVFSSLPASGVSTIEGAIAFTRIEDAHSAANARVSPSMAPLEADTCV